MPVTFTISTHSAAPVERAFSTPILQPRDILHAHATEIHKQNLRRLRPEDHVKLRHPKVLQSSFGLGRNHAKSLEFSSLDLRTGHSGLVKTVVEAYSRHHHLILRPDDVWIAILSQFNIYVNRNSKKLRSYFVQHERKKRLVVGMPGTRDSVDFRDLSIRMADKIQENIVDPSLKDWILPDFSTTTANDTVVCAVMLMSTMQSYFEYVMTLCGIPSITLEGSKQDWEKLLLRLEKLPSFGNEPSQWAALLRPILQRFVQTFDVVQAESALNTEAHEELKEFYTKVASQYSFGSGTDYLSGWITAFCVWDRHDR